MSQLEQWENTIQRGDCLKLMPQLPDGCVDLVVTDPPFKLSQAYSIQTDPDNLFAVASILRAFPLIANILKNSRFCVTFYDNRILPFLFDAVKGTELRYRRQIFLYRRWGNANAWLGWMQCTDPVCFFVKGNEGLFKPEIRSQIKHDCYIKSSPEPNGNMHPAQKPLEFVKDIIKWCSNEGDLILDPFAGSGTTLVAAKELGRRFLGFDIEQKYVDIANERLRQEVLNF